MIWVHVILITTTMPKDINYFRLLIKQFEQSIIIDVDVPKPSINCYMMDKIEMSSLIVIVAINKLAFNNDYI
jgi:hypothetical protein